jgi:hypothetical protein
VIFRPIRGITEARPLTSLPVLSHPLAMFNDQRYNQGMRKNLKNYTAETPVESSIAKIEALVVKQGATQFFKEYKGGLVIGVVFIVPILSGELPIRLPARVEQVKQKLYGRRSEYTLAMEEQARRTAWANIRDWLDAQMALIETEQVKLEEIFLPYMTDRGGKTLFEYMQENQFKLPQLTKGGDAQPIMGKVL